MAVCLLAGEYFGAVDAAHECSDLHITETGYAAGVKVPQHMHELPYVCLVLAGSFTEHSGTRAHACSTGSVLFHPAGEVHADAFGDRGGTCLNVQFNGDWLEHLEANHAPRTWTPVRSSAASWLVHQMRCETARADELSRTACEGLALALVAEIGRMHPLRSIKARPAWIDLTIERLHDTFRQPVRIVQLAREAGVHPVHFSRAFLAHTGCTPVQMIRRLRIEWACRQLRASVDPVSVIAANAGFADHAHFCRNFKIIVGQSPSEYRVR